MKRIFLCSILSALFSLVVGCSSGNSTAQVEGEVTFDGKPIEAGVIVFECQGARPATGKIENGKIVNVTTLEPGDGASVGLNRVSIQATAKPNSANYMSGESLLPRIYGDPATSGLTAEIESGKANVVRFELKKNP